MCLNIYSFSSFKNLFFKKTKKTKSNFTIFNEKVLSYFIEYNRLEKFNKLLKETGSYISGSSLLFYTEGDLDIFVPPGKAEQLIKFINNLGYDSITDDSDSYNYEYKELDLIRERKYYKVNEGNKKIIDIIECENPLRTISKFDLTCCMNWYNGEILYYFNNNTSNSTGDITNNNTSTVIKLSLFKYDNNGNEIKFVVNNEPNTKYNKYCIYNTYSGPITCKKQKRIDKYTKRGYKITSGSINTNFFYFQFTNPLTTPITN